MTTDGSNNAVLVERLLPAPAPIVWRAFTDSAALSTWFWPASLRPAASTDPRPGGALRIEGEGIGVSGRYTVVDPPRRAELTWQWDGEQDESRVSVTLSELDGDTALRLEHCDLAEADRDNHRIGWSHCLDRLARYLAGPADVPHEATS